jgi:molecular chaperone GrpE
MPKKETAKAKVKKTAKSKESKKVSELKNNVKKIEKNLSQAESDLEKSKDRNVRLLAEFDNYKRRTRDEKLHLSRYSGEKIVCDLLPVFDDLHRSLENSEKTDEKSFKDGIELINSKLLKVLEEHSILPIVSIGEEFNPEYHEALMSEDGEEDDIVLKEFEKGYKYHDRIIRHAKVVVSKKQ